MDNVNRQLKTIQLSNYQLFVMMIGSTAAFGHFVYVHLVINQAGRDGWLSLLISVIVGAMILWLHMSIAKRFPGQSLAELTVTVYGKYIGRLIVLLYTLFFLAVSAITIKILSDFMTLVYPTTPPGIFLVCELTLTGWVVLLGKEVLARTVELLLPGLILLGLSATFLSAQDKDVTELLPILARGWQPIWSGALIFITMFAELVVFGTFAGNANTPNKLPRQALLVTGILTVMFLSPVTGPVLVFGEALAKRLAYPTFTEIQYIQIRDIVERFDIIGVLLWTAGSFIRITVFIYGTVNGLSVVLGAKSRRQYLLPSVLIVGGTSLALMQSSREEVYHLLGTTYIPVTLSVGVGIPILTFVVLLVKSQVFRKIAHPRKS